MLEQRWGRFAGPYDTQAEALRALLDAYDDDADRIAGLKI